MRGEEFADPVCGMTADKTKHRVQHEGTTYYFCSGHCMAEFIKNPEKCLKVK